MHKIFLIISIILLSSQYTFAEQYLCIAEESTGFSYDKGTKDWKSMIFTDENKYIVKKSKNAKHAYEVKMFGSNFSVARCENGFDAKGLIYCDGLQSFSMNKTNMRFVISSIFLSYLHGGNEGKINGIKDSDSDSTFISIGKCSPF